MTRSTRLLLILGLGSTACGAQQARGGADGKPDASRGDATAGDALASDGPGDAPADQSSACATSPPPAGSFTLAPSRGRTTRWGAASAWCPAAGDRRRACRGWDLSRPASARTTSGSVKMRPVQAALRARRPPVRRLAHHADDRRRQQQRPERHRRPAGRQPRRQRRPGGRLPGRPAPRPRASSSPAATSTSRTASTSGGRSSTTATSPPRALVGTFTYFNSAVIPQATEHWPKMLDVARDGTLYITNGSSQSQTCSQTEPVFGAIFRASADGGLTEVSMGFRNPNALRCETNVNECSPPSSRSTTWSRPGRAREDRPGARGRQLGATLLRDAERPLPGRHLLGERADPRLLRRHARVGVVRHRRHPVRDRVRARQVAVAVDGARDGDDPRGLRVRAGRPHRRPLARPGDGDPDAGE